MAAPLLLNNSTVLAKVESTYGTDSTPAVGTDALLTGIPTVSPDGQLLERNYTDGTLSQTPAVMGRKLQNASFEMEWKSEIAAAVGNSGDPLEADAIYRAMGFTPTYTAESGAGVNDGNIAYDFVSSAFESATFYFYFQDVLYKMRGAFCNGTFSLVAGQLPVINVDVLGLYDTPTDSTPSSPTVVTDKGLMVESIALSIDSTTLVARSVEIALNNNIIERPDVNSAEGLKGLRIAGRAPQATVVIEEELIATYDPWSAMEDASEFAVSFTQGSGDGKEIAASMPKCQIVGITPGDDNGIRTLSLALRLNKSAAAGNDEFTVTYS